MKSLVINTISILFIGMSSASARVAVSGPSSSGGGNAVVCRDTNGEIQSAEVLDLYEAKLNRGFEIIESSGDFLNDYTRALNNGYRLQGVINPMSSKQILENIKRFDNLVKLVPKDEKLPNVGDIGTEIKTPENCQIEQVAIYYDEQNRIELDAKTWAALDSLNQAALVVHETNYRFLRKLPVDADVDSQEARILTASSFAKNLVPATAGLSAQSESFTACSSAKENGECINPTIGRKDVLLGNDGAKEIKLQFLSIAGRPVLTKTTLVLPFALSENSTFKLSGQQFGHWTAKVSVDNSRGPWAVKIVLLKGNRILSEIPL